MSDGTAIVVLLPLALFSVGRLPGMATPVDYDIAQEIFIGVKQYEDANQGLDLRAFERTVKTAPGEVPGGISLSHHPEDVQMSQIYRISADPANTELERLAHLNIHTGRIISTFEPIAGEDWRGMHRTGGAIMAVDFNGNEYFQFCVTGGAPCANRSRK